MPALSAAATKLDRIVAEFADLLPRERLELLLEFAESLPPLPPRYQAERDRGEHRVQECQTPVFLWAEVRDGRVHVYGDVAPEAPTVKGFVGILVDAFDDSTPQEVLAVEPNLLTAAGASRSARHDADARLASHSVHDPRTSAESGRENNARARRSAIRVSEDSPR